MSETRREGEEVHDGLFWLNYFGLGHRANEVIKLPRPMSVDGVMTDSITAAQFPAVCGDEALDMLEGVLATEGSVDPDEQRMHVMGREYAGGFLRRYLPDEAS